MIINIITTVVINNISENESGGTTTLVGLATGATTEQQINRCSTRVAVAVSTNSRVMTAIDRVLRATHRSNNIFKIAT